MEEVLSFSLYFFFYKIYTLMGLGREFFGCPGTYNPPMITSSFAKKKEEYSRGWTYSPPPPPRPTKKKEEKGQAQELRHNYNSITP